VVVIQTYFRRWKAKRTVANLRYARSEYQRWQQETEQHQQEGEQREQEWDMYRYIALG
jgi:hypothetical protein